MPWLGSNVPSSNPKRGENFYVFIQLFGFEPSTFVPIRSRANALNYRFQKIELWFREFTIPWLGANILTTNPKRNEDFHAFIQSRISTGVEIEPCLNYKHFSSNLHLYFIEYTIF